MSSSSSSLRGSFERWVPWVLGVLCALPFVWARYPPMGDLAFHEAAVSLLRHWGDPRFEPPGLYALNLFEPNQLFHLLALPLAFVMPTDWACKLVVALVAFSIPVAAGRLASHLGVTRWGAALVAPLALGWMTRWGLVANLLGFALLLACLPSADDAARAPSLPRALLGMLLAGLLYLAHESSMLLFGVAVVIFAVRTPRRLGPLALSLCPAFLVGALAAVYHVRSAVLKAPSVLAASDVGVSVVHRVMGLPLALFSVGRSSVPLFLGSVGAVVILVVASRNRDERYRDAVRGRARFVVLGSLALLGYLFVPEALFGSTLVYQRFLATAFALLLLALLPRRPPTSLACLVALVPCAMLVCTELLFVDSDRSYRALDVLLDQMEDGAAVAQLDLNPREPSSVAPVVGAAARALAVHGGRMLFSFTDAPTYPVTMPPLRRWDEPVRRMVMTPFAFEPSYDFTRFRYVLVSADAPRMQAILVRAFAPEGRLLGNRGSWMLFESQLPLDSIVDDDRSPPSPRTTSLAERVKERASR